MAFSEGGARTDLTDHSIAYILREAQEMQMKGLPEPDNLKTPHGQCLSPDSSQNRRLKKFDSDDIPQEKVCKIYQEELVKYFREPCAFQGASSLFQPHWSSGNPMVRTQDETRMALEVYHSEMMKLNQVQGLSNLVLPVQNPLNGVQDLSIPKDKSSKNEDERDRTESNGQAAPDSSDGNQLAFSLVLPKIGAGTTLLFNSDASTQLENTILLPATNDDFVVASSQRPLTGDPVLQPTITQQQLEPYNNVNTEDIAKKVRKRLEQHLISQQRFGELLGISQSCVSNLLVLPKPWHKLSQKRREHYIRMKLFVEDETAVHKLLDSKHENKKRMRKPALRKRLSVQQKEALRLAFDMSRYPDVTSIEFLALELNLSTRTINKWFCKQRYRLNQLKDCVRSVNGRAQTSIMVMLAWIILFIGSEFKNAPVSNNN